MPVLPRKPCSAGKDSWLNAQVRTGPRRIYRGNRGPCQVFGLMLGFAVPRRFCREHRAPCWFLGKMLRSAGSRFRSTGAPKMPGNSSNQGHYTPSAVVKCKFPLSKLRGEATYCGGHLSRTPSYADFLDPNQGTRSTFTGNMANMLLRRCGFGFSLHSWHGTSRKTLKKIETRRS